MTCIVGLIDKETGKIYIGADSAGDESKSFSLRTRKDPKVFIRNSFIIGFTSSFRMGQLLMSDGRFKVRKKIRNESDYEYMVSAFVPAVQKLFTDGGYIRKKSEELFGGTFIVGYNHRLYTIFNDFQVGEYYEEYAACGCGEDYAMGSLFSTRNSSMSPEERIKDALLAAEKFSAGVRSPFNIINM